MLPPDPLTRASTFTTAKALTLAARHVRLAQQAPPFDCMTLLPVSSPTPVIITSAPM